MFADLVLKSSAVFTALGDRSQPGAVAIAGDRIADVGPVDEVLGRCGEGAEVIDLGDSFVCPGFIDSHLHFHTAAMNRSRLSVFCEGSCAEDCVDALAAVEDARPRDEFMLSYGWYHPLWRNPSLPTRDILDRAYPDRPVCLMGPTSTRCGSIRPASPSWGSTRARSRRRAASTARTPRAA